LRRSEFKVRYSSQNVVIAARKVRIIFTQILGLELDKSCSALAMYFPDYARNTKISFVGSALAGQLT